MNAYATLEFLPNTTNNGRTVRRALIELTSFAGQWLGSFTAFGLTTQDTKDRAYSEANMNLQSKGFTLQYLAEAA